MVYLEGFVHGDGSLQQDWGWEMPSIGYMIVEFDTEWQSSMIFYVSDFVIELLPGDCVIKQSRLSLCIIFFTVIYHSLIDHSLQVEEGGA